MTKLVTGGSGFLGSALIKKLIERGAQVKVYDLAAAAELPAGVEFIQGDVRDLEKLKSAAKGHGMGSSMKGQVKRRSSPQGLFQVFDLEGRSVPATLIPTGSRENELDRT